MFFFGLNVLEEREPLKGQRGGIKKKCGRHHQGAQEGEDSQAEGVEEAHGGQGGGVGRGAQRHAPETPTDGEIIPPAYWCPV